MAVFIGKFIPGYDFDLNITQTTPKFIATQSGSSANTTVIDATLVTTSYSGATVTGTQYTTQIVTIKNPIFGNIPTISFVSNNTGIAGIDILGNIGFVSTGNFSITASYSSDSYYPANSVTKNLVNLSGGTTSGTSLSYIFNPVDISKHVLVVYNSGSVNSTNLKTYYTGRRPNFGAANVLAINCYTGESVSYDNFTGTIRTPIVNYLTSVSGTKPIRYIVMMMDIPTRVSTFDTTSVSCQLYNAYSQLNLRGGLDYQYRSNRFSLGEYRGTTALISYINFATYTDCTGYINKISAGQTGIYLSGNGLNTGFYFEDVSALYDVRFTSGRYFNPLLGENSALKYVYRGFNNSYITTGNNLAGFCTWGANGGRGPNYANNGTINWAKQNNWYVMTTIESFNGQRSLNDQGNFTDWMASGAFGGFSYENCPVGATCTTDEPSLQGVTNSGLFTLWQRGWTFIEAAWQSRATPYFLAVGDPLVIK